MEIIFGHSLWLLPAALLAAGFGAFLMYWFRDKNAEELTTQKRYLLSGLRFVCLFVLAVLLLEPLLKTNHTKIEKPVILLAIDESTSMIMAKDSLQVRQNLSKQVEQLSQKLGSDYKVVSGSFGDDFKPEVNYQFSRKSTNLAKSMSTIAGAYAAANLGAVVVVSDGIVTSGENPLYGLNELKVPVFTIATGDTTEKVDGAIATLRVNRTAVKNNEFPVQVEVHAKKLAGRSGQLSLISGNQTLATLPVSVSNNHFVKEFTFHIKAAKAGLNAYQLVLKPMGAEQNLSNNTHSFFVDVLENKEKILVCYSGVHPDVGAVVRSLENSPNFDIEVKSAAQAPQNLQPYSLVVYHQTGVMDALQKKLWEQIVSLGKPLWLFAGPNSDWNFLNRAEIGVKLNGASGQNLVQGRINTTFQWFTADVYSQSELYDFPPVAVPFGELTCSPALVPLYYQQLDRLTTDAPLLAFNQTGGARKAYFFGEGLWKWRMAEFAETQTHEKFNALVGNCVQFLTADGLKKPLQVYSDRQYAEGDEVLLTAELYNSANSFVAGQEILFTLNHNDSVNYRYAFNKESASYELPLSNLAPGKYNYKAVTELAGKKLSDAGSFVVTSVNLEAVNTVANHEILYQMAAKTGGKMLYQSEMGKLADYLKKNELVKPISFSTAAIRNAIQLKWVFFALVAMLATEWFVRKRSGLN